MTHKQPLSPGANRTNSGSSDGWGATSERAVPVSRLVASIGANDPGLHPDPAPNPIVFRPTTRNAHVVKAACARCAEPRRIDTLTADGVCRSTITCDRNLRGY